MKRLVVHRDAEYETSEATSYYEERLRGLGLAFADEIERCYAVIQGDPQRFPFHKRTPMRRCVVNRFPYVIFFREFEERISIVAVAHAKRAPQYWIRRQH